MTLVIAIILGIAMGSMLIALPRVAYNHRPVILVGVAIIIALMVINAVVAS